MFFKAENWPVSLIMAIAILMWTPGALLAQAGNETPGEETADQVTPEEAESERQETGQEESEPSEPIPIDTEEPPSRFIPSEEISEDSSVAFPVDI